MLLVWFVIHSFFVSGGFGTNRGPIKKPSAFPSSNITQEMPFIIKRASYYLIIDVITREPWKNMTDLLSLKVSFESKKMGIPIAFYQL